MPGVQANAGWGRGVPKLFQDCQTNTETWGPHVPPGPLVRAETRESDDEESRPRCHSQFLDPELAVALVEHSWGWMRLVSAESAHWL